MVFSILVHSNAIVVRGAVNERRRSHTTQSPPPCSVGYEAERTEKGEHLIWLEDTTMRGPGESYSDVIIRLAASER
jgi:hypothetical protein